MTKKVRNIIIGVLCLILVIVIVAFAIAKHLHNQKVAAATSNNEAATEQMPVPTADTQETTEYDPLADLKLSLTVDIDRQTLETMYNWYSREFLDSSMPNQNNDRTLAASYVGWSKPGTKMYDAVSFPFTTVEKGKKEYTDEDIEKMLDELREEIIRNPVVGDMLLQGMQYMALTDGTTMAELNEDWVQEFLDKYDEYGCGVFVTYHTRYWEKYGFELPHDGEDVEAWREEHPNAPMPTDEELELIPLDDDDTLTPATTIAGTYGRQGRVEKPAGVYKLYVTDYYVNTMKRALAWLDRCNCEGVETYSTSTFWYLNSTQNANKVRTLLNEDKTYVDRQPALVFSVLTKDEKRQLLFGFNIYDMRLEIFNRTSTPVQPDPDPTPRPDPKPDPDPTPDPTPTPVPDPDPNPDPVKDPTKDPVHNGNADTGGGEGQGETGDPTPDPSLNDMQDAHGGPDTNQGHSDPSTVKPGPNPSDTHQDNIGNEDDGNPNTVEQHDENQMDYGEENHDQHDSVTDDSGNTSNPDDQPAGGEFDEPPV